MKRSYPIVSLLLALWVTDAAACGLSFPSCYLAQGRERHVVNMPKASFYHEMERLSPNNPGYVPYGQGNQWDRTLASDLADLASALGESGMSAEDGKRVVAQYKQLRENMRAHPSSTSNSFVPTGSREPSEPFDLGPHSALLGEIPQEFRLYLEGAVAYRANDVASAIERWETLLSLPADKRRHRSVWASFMIGKANIGGDDRAAIENFETVRRLATQGFRDSLGLAEVSIGWQAMAERNSGDALAALKHYFVMFDTGSPRSRRTGHTSLRRLLQKLAGEEKLYPTLIADDMARRLVTIWMLSSYRGRSWMGAQYGRWLEAVEASGASIEASEADRLAWLAYNTGHVDEARRWLAVSDEPTLYGRWVQSKLHMRDGKIEEAVASLRELTAAFPASDQWSNNEFDTAAPRNDTGGELGVLLLGRKEYVSALDALARAGFWWDAAYVAERVLTVDELAAYVDRNGGDKELQRGTNQAWTLYRREQASRYQALRYLLARRLAREERFARARDYYPDEWRPVFDRYVKALADGRDKKRTKRQRAEGLYQAGRLMREKGMELLGTELERDWTVLDGRFNLSEVAEKRRESPSRAAMPGMPDSLTNALSASKDELARADAHAAQPDKRFHYRYLASDLMWECAQLLPDNDPLTGKALYYGGVWHKSREVELADRFYKSLVRRCPKLPIAQQADRLRWFPSNPPK